MRAMTLVACSSPNTGTARPADRGEPTATLMSLERAHMSLRRRTLPQVSIRARGCSRSPAAYDDVAGTAASRVPRQRSRRLFDSTHVIHGPVAVFHPINPSEPQPAAAATVHECRYIAGRARFRSEGGSAATSKGWMIVRSCSSAVPPRTTGLCWRRSVMIPLPKFNLAGSRIHDLGKKSQYSAHICAR